MATSMYMRSFRPGSGAVFRVALGKWAIVLLLMVATTNVMAYEDGHGRPTDSIATDPAHSNGTIPADTFGFSDAVTCWVGHFPPFMMAADSGGLGRAYPIDCVSPSSASSSSSNSSLDEINLSNEAPQAFNLRGSLFRQLGLDVEGWNVVSSRRLLRRCPASGK